MSRWSRKLLRGLAWTLMSMVLIVVGGAIAILLWARSTAGTRRLTAELLAQIEPRLHGKLTIGKLSGSLTRDLILDDVRVYDAEGALAVRIDRLSLRYDLTSLFRHGLRIEDARVEGGLVHARRLADGRLNLATLSKPSATPSPPSSQPFAIAVAALSAEATVEYAPGAGDSTPPVRADLRVEGHAHVAGARVDAAVKSLTLASRAPMRALVDAVGTAHLDGDDFSVAGVDVRVRAEGRELDRVAPAARLRGPLNAELRADGPARALAIALTITPERGELRANARVRFSPSQPIAWQAQVNAHDLDPAVRAGLPHGAVELSAHAHGEDARGEIALERLFAQVAGANASAHGTVTLGSSLGIDLLAELHARDLSRLAVAGGPALAGRLDARAHVDNRDGALGIDADVEGRALAAGTTRIARLDAHARARGLRGIGTVRVHGLTVAAGATPLHFHALELDAAGDRAHLTLDLDASGEDGALVQLRARGKPLPGSAYSAELTLDELILGARNQRWHTSRPGRLRADDRVVSIELALANAAQQLSLSARLDRPTSALSLRAAGRALDARAIALLAGTRAPTTHIDFDLDGHLAGGRAHATLDAHSDQQRIHASVDAPLTLAHDSPLSIDVDARALDLAQLRALLPAPLQSLDGRAQLTLALHGTVADPSLTARLEVPAYTLDALAGDRMATTIDVGYRARRLRAHVDAALKGAPILSLQAESPIDARALLAGKRWQDSPIRVDATIPKYDLSRAGKLAGTLEGSLAVRGTFAHPNGQARLDGAGLAFSGTKFPSLNARASVRNDVLDAQLDAHETPQGDLHASAHVPFAADAPLSVSLTAKQLALSLANLGSLRRLDGRLDAALTVSGTRAKPIAKGELHVQKGALALADDPRLYHDLAVDLFAQPGRIELRKLYLAIGMGSLTASGSASLDGAKPTQVDLTAQASKLPVMSNNVGAWVDAHAELHGKRQDGKLAGTLTLTKGTARLPKLSSTRSLQSTGPLEDVVYVDAATLAKEKAREQAKRAGEPETAEVIAHMPGPFHVRSPELVADLKGDLDVHLVDGVAKLRGHVESTFGHLELLGRRYELERARIGFSGNVDPDPTLDIRVTRDITDTTVIIEVHGTAKKPELVLASDPPIYDSSQIIGIIVSGDPGNQQIDARSTDQKVVGAISGLLVNQIKNQVAPGLPVDVIKVDTGTDDSFGGLGTTRVEVGKYLTENVYVSYVHQFGTPVGLHRVNSNEADLEYRFKRHYEVATKFGDAGVGSLDLYWTLRY